jgi:diguanylate cyclase (GGDEF)-like protein/PAS domain S-box-containing protein
MKDSREDVSKVLEETREILQKSEEWHGVLFEKSTQGILVTDLESKRFLLANPSICQMFGYSKEELLQLGVADIHPKDSLGRLASEFESQVRGEKPITLMLPCLRKDGTIFYVNIVGANTTVNGRKCIVGFFVDATDRKKVENALRERERKFRELSIIDDLTRLYNSRHFRDDQLEMEIRRVNRYEQALTLLFLDIDNFKVLNDTYGHLEGDRILSQFGQIIKKCLRQTDSAYRYGGEEFAIMLPITTDESGSIIAERIRAEIEREAFSLSSGRYVNMTVSIGVAQYKQEEDAEGFVRRVDQALYQAKKDGKNQVCIK